MAFRIPLPWSDLAEKTTRLALLANQIAEIPRIYYSVYNKLSSNFFKMLERNERIAMNLCYKKTQLPPKRQTTFKDYISFKLNGIENFTFNHESTMY